MRSQREIKKVLQVGDILHVQAFFKFTLIKKMVSHHSMVKLHVILLRAELKREEEQLQNRIRIIKNDELPIPQAEDEDPKRPIRAEFNNGCHSL